MPGCGPQMPLSLSFSPIFVSLYRDTKEIVVGGGTDAIRAAQSAGKATVPVVIVYNHSFQRPLSRFGAEASVSDVANEFFNNRIEVTPVPEWKDGRTWTALGFLAEPEYANPIWIHQRSAVQELERRLADWEAQGATVNDKERSIDFGDGVKTLNFQRGEGKFARYSVIEED